MQPHSSPRKLVAIKSLSRFAYSVAGLLPGDLCALHSAAQTDTATIATVGTLQATGSEYHLVIVYCQLLDC